MQRDISTSRYSGKHSVKLISCHLAGWYWQAGTTSISQAISEGLSSLPYHGWSSGDYFEWNSVRRILPNSPATQTLLHPGKWTDIPEEAILNILWGQWWVWINSLFLEDWFLNKSQTIKWVSPPPPVPSQGICSVLSRTRAPEQPLHAAGTLKVMLSFRSCGALHTSCIPSGHWILTFHEAGEADIWTKGSKDSASQRSGLWALHILVNYHLHSPGHFISLWRAPAFNGSYSIFFPLIFTPPFNPPFPFFHTVSHLPGLCGRKLNRDLVC